jgi:hypothetical protein
MSAVYVTKGLAALLLVASGILLVAEITGAGTAEHKLCLLQALWADMTGTLGADNHKHLRPAGTRTDIQIKAASMTVSQTLSPAPAILSQVIHTYPSDILHIHITYPFNILTYPCDILTYPEISYVISRN